MPVEEFPKEDSQLLIEQMRQSLGLLRVAFDSTGEAMLIIDQSEVVSWANQQAADLWGQGITLQMVGRPFSSLIRFYHPTGRQVKENEPNHPLQKALLKDGFQSYQIQALTPNSSDSIKKELIERMVSWRQINQMNKQFTLLIFRDLNPLEKALQAQRLFINHLAHELRTPLTILKGNLLRIQRKAHLPGELKQSVSDASEETKRMGKLVENLLLLSELDTELHTWNMQCGNLKMFVEQWMITLNPEQKKYLQIHRNSTIKNNNVQIDQKALNLILDNLLDNSIRFSQSETSIQILIKETIDHIELHFIDNGPGIQTKESLTAIFERFTRIEEHRNAAHTEGSGLGLALVKSLMKGLEGTVSCHSNHPPLKSTAEGLVVKLQFPHLK